MAKWRLKMKKINSIYGEIKMEITKMQINPKMKISEFRGAVDAKVMEAVKIAGISDFAKDKVFGEYKIKDVAKIISLLQQFDKIFGLEKTPLQAALNAPKEEEQIMQFFCDLTFDRIANKICQIMVTNRAKEGFKITKHNINTNTVNKNTNSL